MAKLRQSTNATLKYVRERYGDRDPRVLTLRSILSSCEIAEAVMQLVFTSVERALGDSQSLLSKAVSTALKVGMTVPTKFMGTEAGSVNEQELALKLAALDHLDEEDDDADYESDQPTIVSEPRADEGTPRE